MAHVFVFGSNTQGRHGRGAAKVALRYGAKYGRSRGRVGNTYAICTKELRPYCPGPSLKDISEQIADFKAHVEASPSDTFYVTRVGCGLAGFQDHQIAPLFGWAINHPRVHIPPYWLLLQETP